jgi:hypothetical protein
MSPFDYVKSLTKTKEYIFDEQSEKSYNTFLVNKSFSYYQDCIFHSNLINQYPNIEKKMNYDYYYYFISKKSRFAPWKKEDENTLYVLECIKRYFSCSDKVAKEYIKILSEENIKHLVKIYKDIV